MTHKLKIWGWILVLLGVVMVYLPHIAFLADLIPSLNVISHSVFEIIAATVILVGAIMLGMCKRRRKR